MGLQGDFPVILQLHIGVSVATRQWRSVSVFHWGISRGILIEVPLIFGILAQSQLWKIDTKFVEK